MIQSLTAALCRVIQSLTAALCRVIQSLTAALYRVIQSLTAALCRVIQSLTAALCRAQFVLILHDASGTLLKTSFTFPCPIAIWQEKEYLGSQLLAREEAAEDHLLTLTTLTKSTIEICGDLVAVLADHKAAGSILGRVGSGGDCRVESARAGLRIGHTGDEELVRFSSLEDHVHENLNMLFAVASDLVDLLKKPSLLFSNTNQISEWVATHKEYGYVLPRKPSRAAALEALTEKGWPPVSPAGMKTLLSNAMSDGTFSRTKFNAVFASEVTAFGSNSFPCFTEMNPITFRDIMLPECARIIDSGGQSQHDAMAAEVSWITGMTSTEMLLLLLHIDHIGVAEGHSYYTRSNIVPPSVSRLVSEGDITAQFLSNPIDMRSVIVVPGHQHNLGHIGKQIIKVGLGKDLHPDLKKMYGKTAGEVETTVARVTSEILKGMRADSLNGEHTYVYHVMHAFQDWLHTFRSSPPPVQMTAGLCGALLRYYSRRGRSLRDRRMPELSSSVQYSSDTARSPRTLAATRYGDDDSEISFASGVVGALVMAFEAVTDDNVTTASNYWSSQRSTLVDVALHLKKHKRKRNDLLDKFDECKDAAARKIVDADLKKHGPALCVQAANEMNGVSTYRCVMIVKRLG